jgi:hypothetical protein
MPKCLLKDLTGYLKPARLMFKRLFGKQATNRAGVLKTCTVGLRGYWLRIPTVQEILSDYIRLEL